MTSHTTAGFRSSYARLPAPLRLLARRQYLLWKVNPYHPSLHFKKVSPILWSSRINSGYRALATTIPGGYLWIWIGSHDEYLRVIRGK